MKSRKEELLEIAQDEFIEEFKYKLTRNNRYWYLKHEGQWKQIRDNNIHKFVFNWLRKRKQGLGKYEYVSPIVSEAIMILKYCAKTPLDTTHYWKPMGIEKRDGEWGRT
jgi:hypothetical protein